MGKKLKYCSSCEEGFAERFTFCPDCGGSLQVVEMNPVVNEVVPTADTQDAKFDVIQPVISEPAILEEPQPAAVQDEPAAFADYSPAQPPSSDPVHEEPEHIVEATAAGSYFEPPATEAFSMPVEPRVEPSNYHYVPDEAFHVTVIEEKNSRQRNGLLLGSTVFVIAMMLSATVYSLFAKDISIGSIGDGDIIAMLPQVDPDMVEIEKPEVKKKDDSGGGGGGGNDEKDPASKGAPPAMMRQPEIAPDAHAVRLTNPELTQVVGVKGPDQAKIDLDKRYGVLNGADGESNGPGTGGGIGTGRGGGVGSGNGSGLGSGSGGGAGAGNGGGIGDGDGGVGGPPGAIPKGETVALNITSKPRADYTDAARQNNIQGVVRLKVTFLANGQIGAVSAVSGLPNGLTEKAIAAAKNMRFTPKKVNGVAVPVARVVEYSFTIY